MRLALDDGYTLPFSTSPDGKPNPATGEPSATGLPVVTGRYRPAVFAAVQEFQYRLGRAASGREEADVIAEFVAAHVTDWDVTLKGATAAVSAENVRRMPAVVVDHLVGVVSRWAPAEQEKAAGNS